jgi:hypothetical protein
MSGNTMNSSTKNIVDWNATDFKYMPMYVGDRGNKSVSLQNLSTRGAIKLRLPMMMTWGIQDYTDQATGESNGKFTISLNFPRDDDDLKCEETDMALEKLKEFEAKIIDDAVTNSVSWFGKKLPKEVVEHSYFSFIKYTKNKDTGEPDTTKPPSLKVKVPYYKNDGKMDWKIDLYSMDAERIFPVPANPDLMPQDLVPKLSKIICYIQCTGLWFGGKGWGLTWKMTAGMVNPHNSVSYDRAPPLELSQKERELFGKPATQPQTESAEEPASEPLVVDTQVVDSDDEAPAVVEEPPKVDPPKKKKVVKKVAKPSA